MTKLTLRLALVGSLVALAACSPRLIPNTKIQDTPDNRAIIDIVRQYKTAYEMKDATTIASLASPRYLDPRESISHATLATELAKDFEKVKQLQLDITLRRIEVQKSDAKGERAEVDYFYSTSFLLASTDSVWKTETDEKRMILERLDGQWRVLSGF